MTELRIGDQLISFDREATAAAYSQVSQGWADRCTCQGCRNFVLQRDRIYPVEFRDLLNTLGVDPSKEGEAVHYGPVGELHFYEGWFYLVGKLLEAGERNCSIGNDFEYFAGTSFPRPPAAFGKGVIVIEFATHLSWVLDKPWNLNADYHTAQETISKQAEILKRSDFAN